MKAMTIVAILAAMAVTNIAGAEAYKWQDELCDMQGNFDNKKYTAKQIKNSHFVLEGLTRANLQSFFPPMNINDIDNVSKTDITNLDKEYESLKRKVEPLEVVPAAQTYKRELLKSIEGEYVHDRLSILAYIDPIQAMRLSPPMCKQYLEPFFKNETAVQRKWRQFIEQRIEQQALMHSDGGQSYRKFATERYEEEKASDPANYAKISLLTFGFGNCVDNQIDHADSQKVFSHYNQLNKTLFGKSIKRVCEEP